MMTFKVDHFGDVSLENTIVTRISVQARISMQDGITKKKEISVQGGILLKILKRVQGENWQFYSQ